MKWVWGLFVKLKYNLWIKLQVDWSQSLKWKFEFTDPNQILEFIFYIYMYLNQNWNNLLVLGRRTGADCEECEALLKKNGGWYYLPSSGNMREKRREYHHKMFLMWNPHFIQIKNENLDTRKKILNSCTLIAYWYIQKNYPSALSYIGMIVIPPLHWRGVYCFTVCPSQDIFRCIFLSNYWWQKSDIWSQAS